MGSYKMKHKGGGYGKSAKASEGNLSQNLFSNSLNTPLVSVITAILNGEKYLKDCIESVLSQSYPNIQHIIVDGGSTDNTIEILNTYNDKLAVWVSEPDAGIYSAINKGIHLSKGDFYIVLGCDDTLMPNAIEVLISRIESKLAICGLASLIDRNDNHKSLIYAHSAGTLIRTSAHQEVGFYDESYKIAADTKFLQKIRIRGGLLKINEVVGNFRDGGISSSYRKTIKEHARAMQEAGAWGRLRSLVWLVPRMLYSNIRK